jgi:septation ring formation regulator EzrA
MAELLSRRERIMRAQLSDHIKEGIDLRERLGQLRDKIWELECKLRALNCDPNAISALKALQDKNDALRREIHRLKRENSLIHRQLAYGRYAEAAIKEIQKIKEQLAEMQAL